MTSRKKSDNTMPDEPVDSGYGPRKRRQFYLLGFPLPSFAPNRLPTNGKLLRRYYWLNVDKRTSTRQQSFKIGCSLASGKTYLRCSKFADGHCVEDYKQPLTGVCILRELVTLWERAGFDSTFIMSEQTIRKRISQKVTEYQSLSKLKTLNLAEGSYKVKVNGFLEESSILFPIHKKNIFHLIRNDPHRDKAAQKEDVTFLKHCFKGEMVKMAAAIDTIFQKNVSIAEENLKIMEEKIQAQEARIERKKEKEKRKEEDLANRKREFEIEISFDTDCDSLLESNESSSPPTKEKKKKISSEVHVSMQLSMDDLLHNWIPIMSRYGIGTRPGTCLLTSLYKQGGVDIENLKISRSTLSRKTHTVVESEAQLIREQNLDKVRGLKLVVHFDTKIVKQYTTEEGISTNHERLAISVSSPESGPLDFLLGVMKIESSKGADQAIDIQSILEYYELSDQIIGVCADTTASNTGKDKGTIRNIVVHTLERPILWLMCRHHIYERHVAHVMKVIMGPTTSPSKVLYVKLQEMWPKINHEVNNLDKIVTFNWKQDAFRPGTLPHQLALETKEFCTTALQRNTFQGGDYKYLCQLLVFFLGSDVPDFTFKQPGAHHEARFMSDCLYFLVLYMTQKYHPADSETVKPSTIKNLGTATNYIVFFHGLFFLKSPMTAQGPSNDLRAFKIAFQLQMNDDLKSYAEIGKTLNQ